MDFRTDRIGQSSAHKITEEAQERLRKNPYSAVRNVLCEYSEGILVLRGQLPNFHHKQLAQEAVAGLPGVTRVVNQTEVVVALA